MNPIINGSKKLIPHSIDVLSQRYEVESRKNNRYTKKQLEAITNYTRNRYFSAFNRWQREGRTSESIINIVNDPDLLL
ncbi:hypothetical protein [Methanosphaera sp. WGK6]|uniref:hypothetical protein n=1 Tax=Methanosphaera sp. WGK6 TaxID=1561964 RepID=UPI00084C68F2|nr:hypothetical protein [Methanosphaera sp. WGK6]OED30344.1 hypothetical protein NL43_02910 [Methanosphaera sp. WGK6]